MRLRELERESKRMKIGRRVKEELTRTWCAD